MLKTPKCRESLEILASRPYRRGHDRDSFRRRFPARRYAILLWLPDIVRALSCSNSAFASLRSGVSMHSVNLVEEMRWKGDAWLSAIP